MKPDTNFQVYPSTAKREKKTLKYIARTCLIYIYIYIRQVLAIYFKVFFLALQCSDKPESWYQAS